MIKLMAFKILFTFTTFFNLDINLINIKIALLYSFINQLIYIKISKNPKIKTIKNMVCKLLKVLYSFKQFSQLLYKKLSIFFYKKLDLKCIHADHSIFESLICLKSSIFSIFINNIKIIISKDSRKISKIKKKPYWRSFYIRYRPH